MAGAAAMKPVSQDEANDALDRLTASEVVATSRQIQQFLRHIVTEEVQGRGDRIKAYTVAVDALGRDSDFDPASDATVRVLARRARNALDAYYANAGAADPVRIELGKGSYRPRLVRRSAASESPPDSRPSVPGPPRPARPWTALTLGVIVTLSLVGLWQFRDRLLPGTTRLDNPPIVEIMPFEAGTTSDGALTAEGIRQQLIIDISRFDSLQVRALPYDGTTPLKPGMQPADYRIGGAFHRGEADASLSVTATQLPSGNILWSDEVKLPANDAEFQNLLYSTIRSIVTRLASTTGAIHTEAINRLRNRSEKLGNTSTSNYECVLHYYAYDLTKSAAEQEAARTCLSRLTRTGTQDSSVWASWAFMQFLDWTRTGDSTNAPLFRSALADARKATQLDPYNATAFEKVGAIELAAGNYQEALDNYRRAIELNPSKPDLYVLLGWYQAMAHDWNQGIPMVRKGIALSPAPAGWMRIPLSIDAFRRGEYQTALAEAEIIMQSGDSRGIILGLAAAIAFNDTETTVRLRTAFEASGIGIDDPMIEIRNVFNVPNILARYERMLARENIGPLADRDAEGS